MKDRSGHRLSLVEGTSLQRAPWDESLFWVLLFGVGVVGVACLGPKRAMAGWALIPWTLAFLGLVVLLRREPPWLSRTVVILGGSLVLRLLFLATQQDLSDDLYRYVWDGWLRINGISPYRWPPEHAALEGFQGDELFQEMNSREWISIYPPLSQLVFLWGGWVHTLAGWPVSAWSIRVGFTLLELGGLVGLHLALRATGASPALLIAYAWNPLVLLSVAGSGHSEGGLILGLGLLLWGIAQGKPALGWAGWVLAVLSKGIPLLLGPLLFRVFWKRTGLKATLVGLVPASLLGLVLLSFFLHPTDLPRIFSSVRLYTDLFAFNGALHPLFRELNWRLLGMETGPLLGRLFVVLTGVVAVWAALRWPAQPLEPTRTFATASLGIFSLYLILTPTVHPWYLLWGLPLVPFAAQTLRAPWLWVSWAGLATYLFYSGYSAVLLALLFWGGALLWALHSNREWIFAPLRRMAGRRKAAWVRPWIAGSACLDVGGAEGHVTEALQATCRGWVVDPEAHRPGDVAACGEKLPFAANAVDTVLLSFVLHHTHDPRGVLAEALRVARHRVVILESVPRTPAERSFLEAVDRWVNAGRGLGGMGAESAPLAMHPTAFWLDLAHDLRASVLHAGRPGGIHPVLLLVLEPSEGESTQSLAQGVDTLSLRIEDA